MAIIASVLARIKSDPFVLLGGPQAINDHFERWGHVWRERVFDPATTLCLFVHQILAGNVAINDLRHLLRWDFAPSSYCEARERLPLEALGRLVDDVSGDCLRSLRSFTTDAGSFFGRRVHLADATTVTTPDEPALQDLWPQPSAQRRGCGFPMIKLLGLLDLATGLIVHVTMMGLNCHEMSQLAGLHARLLPGDVLLADRGFCSFSHLFLLGQMSVDAVFRVHQRRIVDFAPRRPSRRTSRTNVPSSRFVRKLGNEDQLVEWIKPVNKPVWMSPQQFTALPAVLRVREIGYRIVERGRRTRRVLIATTLLNATRYPRQEIARLYGLRWQIETTWRHLKQTMRMDQLKCKTPGGVMKELLIYMLVYNLVRSAIVLAAGRQGVSIDRISVIDALRWMNCRGADWRPALIVNPSRSGRWSPRVKKRRMKEYDLMMRPRGQYAEPSDRKDVAT